MLQQYVEKLIKRNKAFLGVINNFHNKYLQLYIIYINFTTILFQKVGLNAFSHNEFHYYLFLLLTY